MSKHIWLVEDRHSSKGEGVWFPVGDRNGEFRIFLTRKSAFDTAKKGNVYYGHPKDLRVRKYVREEK